VSRNEPDAGEARDSTTLQSLERGLAVIRAFGADNPELMLSEVARAADLTRAAARRFLLTLVDLGYMRTDGRRFALTPRVLELGYAYVSSLSLPDVAEPHLQSLVEKVHEASAVAVLDGDEIVYVARVPVSRIMTVTVHVGTRFPAHATSMGRVLLAGLPKDEFDEYLTSAPFEAITERTVRTKRDLRKEIERARKDGFAIVDQELEEGLRGVAVPIHWGDGDVAAAINLSAHSSRRTREDVRRALLPPLRETAERIEEDLRIATPRPQLATLSRKRSAGPL
jgi:IclR family pca regulon transcriptional regulator